jgi:hypothetical protein
VARPLTASRRVLVTCVAILGLCCAGIGCAVARPRAAVPPRPFTFATDTFAFINESHWRYVTDPATGARAWGEQPVYFALHCAGVVRAARQFLVNARFDPAGTPVDDLTALRLTREVFARDPRTPVATKPPVVIPGYAGLRDFSAAHEPALKDEMLRDWRSVLPRGDWQIVVPFSPAHQARTADALYREVRAGTPAVVRVFRFPVMTINHAVLLYEAAERDGDVEFTAYDPNDVAAPIIVRFDRAAGTFLFPASDYFDGGPVKVYEIYAGPLS